MMLRRTSAVVVSLVALGIAACNAPVADEGEGAAEAIESNPAAETSKDFVFASPFTTPQSFKLPCSASSMTLAIWTQNETTKGSPPSLQVVADGGAPLKGDWSLSGRMSSAWVARVKLSVPIQHGSTNLTFSIDADHSKDLIDAKVPSVNAGFTATCAASGTPSAPSAPAAGAASCKGTPTACGSQSPCGGPGCSAKGVCRGPERHCFDANIYGEGTCQASYQGCVWFNGLCTGNAGQCDTYTNGIGCNLQDKCKWDAAGACTGSATPCAQLNQSDCGRQPGCGWK